MKEVLGVALLVLGAIVGLRVGNADKSSTDLARLQNAVGIQIFSTADGLRPELYIARRTSIAIVVDGAFRQGNIEEAGLRVVAIRDGKSGSMNSFNLASSSDEIGRFQSFCDSAQPGTVLAMAVHRVGSPPLDEQSASRTQLEQLFASLGAVRPPTDSPKSSWAFICVRSEDGWGPIAEAISSSKGVHLSRVLRTSKIATAPQPGSLLIDDWNEILLVDRVGGASYVTGDSRLTSVSRPNNGVRGGPLDSIFAHPPYGAFLKEIGHSENRLRWDALKLPTNGIFHCQLGIVYWAFANSDGVEFQLIINDEMIATKKIGTEPFSPETWVPWSVDLSAYSGEVVRFEMRVAPIGTPSSDHAIWGRPAIEYRAQ